ncbi:CaiB/BaiF CoA transferase family protein [Tropicibacter naphthalenivorans]|uniref:Succinyl-CoA:(R)-benzylsuccinate CoA-transferase subunit BbsF n=1 Tax=Tropicibacter naphthalenivorans TaxID=441103 RepID=A0A0P1GYH0_9RHOB|nr:CaiB/BaiF CoA-transferase family protein [Tropicibacter naphthalenivorans]CUH80981.1 Succinyl-CoA:(R)-benzylsuccinate CoA-transferase subunit BbsF [Tropicibacter naphthalenivorans]SMC91554.1 Crotonobetainyl-CoA:carnitine CoA-transferase CaiB [Tropicibacter naphthalenivorans]
MSGPLSHIRVLDPSRIMAGPWAGQILADMGADVIKVERLGEGDDTRRWGPPFLKDKDGNATREAGYYLSVNRGKRSVELDLKSEEGRAAVRALAAKSDIVLENFKTGTLDRMGLGYEDLKKENPGLIYCSITGFGLSGPMANDAAYDFMIQGMGGLMSVTGGPDDAPGGGPQKVGVPIIDIMTGMYAAIGVLGALANRTQTGQGDHIDLAMLDVSVAMLANQAMNYLVSGNTPVRRGNRHPNIQPQNVYPVSDGFIVLAVGNDGQFRKFSEVIGQPALADDPKFATNAARVENLPELEEILVAALASGTIDEWVGKFAAAGVPLGPLNTIDRVYEEPQVKHREMLRDIPHPLSGTLKQVVSPLNFRNAPLSFEKAPPLLGHIPQRCFPRWDWRRQNDGPNHQAERRAHQLSRGRDHDACAKGSLRADRFRPAQDAGRPAARGAAQPGSGGPLAASGAGVAL